MESRCDSHKIDGLYMNLTDQVNFFTTIIPLSLPRLTQVLQQCAFRVMVFVSSSRRGDQRHANSFTITLSSGAKLDYLFLYT